MSNGKVVNCRECDTPILAGLDGVAVGKDKDNGWCNPCMGKSIYLMAFLSKLVMEDMEFDDVKRHLIKKTRPDDELDEFGGVIGDTCPKCGDDIVEGSQVGACKKCNPEFFEECENCGQERICCPCYTGSMM